MLISLCLPMFTMSVHSDGELQDVILFPRVMERTYTHSVNLTEVKEVYKFMLGSMNVITYYSDYGAGMPDSDREEETLIAQDTLKNNKVSFFNLDDQTITINNKRLEVQGLTIEIKTQIEPLILCLMKKASSYD
jgi:hypothetical protein